ncbi:MAG: winged helix-turn-helix transcriptional regulator [Nitrososphaerota archaeon]|nr:winged helix-turn-helix transcriptional regulator [Nitrososphaerota archaeon]
MDGTRREIYDYIRSHPGTHEREIEKELGIATGDLRYHLGKLSRADLITTWGSGTKFIFPSNLFGEKQEVLLGLLTQETPREILLSITRHPGIAQKELAEELHLSAPTIWWHMDRLLRLGVVGRKKEGKSVTYEVIARREDLLNFIVRYHPTIWDKWASRMHDVTLMLDPKAQREISDE